MALECVCKLAAIPYQGTTSVVPRAAFPPVGFSRCRPNNQGLKALGHKRLALGTPEGVPQYRTSSVVYC